LLLLLHEVKAMTAARTRNNTLFKCFIIKFVCPSANGVQNRYATAPVYYFINLIKSLLFNSSKERFVIAKFSSRITVVGKTNLFLRLAKSIAIG